MCVFQVYQQNKGCSYLSSPLPMCAVWMLLLPCAAVEPEDLYPVFPRQPKPIERLPPGSSSSSKWSWGGGGSSPPDASAAAQAESQARLWNPRTGFMRTRAEVDQEQQQATTSASSAPAGVKATSGSSSSSSSGRAGVMQQQPSPKSPPPASTSSSSNSSSAGMSGSSSGLVERVPQVADPLQPPQLPPSALRSSGQAAAAAVVEDQQWLPAVGRGQVLTSCALTAAAMTAAAVGLSLLAAKQSAGLFGTSQEAIDGLLQLPAGLQDIQQAGVMLGAAGVVTAARLVLKQQWPEFQEATDRSNQQVLSSLGWPDVVLVSLLSGASEELLFRWGLIAATWPDARGVLLSGAVFGALHISGGRNAAFAAWATAVGWLYGAAFLATGNVWVPAGAHAIANFASAAVWITGGAKQPPQQQH